MNIALLIKSLRVNLNKTQFQLAAEAGVSLPTIQKIESGKANPELQTLESILKSLRYSIHFLPNEPDWDALAAYGVPLHTQAHMAVTAQKNNLLGLLKSALSYYASANPLPTSREWESLAAFLLGMKTHFTEIFNELDSLKIQAETLISAQNASRLYKLRRISLNQMAKYL